MEIERPAHKTETPFRIDPVQAWIFGLGLISGIFYILNLKLNRFMPGSLQLTGIYLYIWMALFLNVLYLVGARLVFKNLDRIGRSKRLVILIIAFGMFFRAVLVPSDPDLLSTDMYRYVWDGRVQQHGINPYAYAPSAEQLRTLRDDTIYPKMNRKEYPTIYPAGAQLFFRLFHGLVGDSVPGFKGLMVFFEMLTMLVLVLTLRAYGLQDARIFIYAWNPLVIFEIGYGGHLDGLTVFLTVLAFYLDARKRKLPAVAALAFSSATKLYPALLLPAFLNRGEWIKGAVAFLAFFLLLYLPFFPVGGKIIGFLPNYFTSPYESFNLGLKYLITVLFPELDYVLISKIFILALVAAGLFIFFRKKPDGQVIRYAYVLIGLLIILMPTALHPWYVVILVPFLCFFPSAAWLFFTCMVTLSYLYYEPSMDDLPVWVTLLEYVPLFAILATGYILKRQARPNWGFRVSGQPEEKQL
jgi:alpha-1,6-mannosyltransferase